MAKLFLPRHGHTHNKSGSDPLHIDVGLEILATNPDDEAVELTDGMLYVCIPDDMNELRLIDADASVSTPGAIEVQLRRDRDGAMDDMLSTPITIENGARSSYTAAAQPVIDEAVRQVLTEDFIWIIASSSQGLNVMLTFG